MAKTLSELTAEIVASHAAKSELSTTDLLEEIQKVYKALQNLEGGQPMEGAEVKPTITLKKAFQPDQVICMICGKGGMKTLTRHLAQTHQMKPGEYRKQFGIPSSQPLTAKKFSESRRKMAQEKGLATNLAKARAIRAAKLKAKKEAVAAKPAKATKAAKPAKVAKPAKAKAKK